MRRWLNSSIVFVVKMMGSAVTALAGLTLVLAIIARLDVAFFEANGMAQNADVREAFYYQIFQFDSVILGMLGAGFLAVVVLSFLFCKSQFDYFRHLSKALKLMGETGDTPPTALLGRFNPYTTYFFDIISRRINGETEEGVEPLLARASKEWPVFPAVSWGDQLQFAVMSGLLGLFFSSCCVIAYLKVSGRVVELASSLVRFTATSGPDFLNEQFTIVNMVVWLILILTAASFILTGYRFGRQIAEADYAILRDLKDFMEGNYRKRLFLRAGDPAHEFVGTMNESLDKIAARIRNGAVAPDKKAASTSG